jgi:hypothetical protein
METENRVLSPVSEWWAKAAETLKSLSGFTHDRKLLLQSSGHAAVEHDGQLRNTSFQFAMLSIMVPVLITGLVIKLVAIRELPPTSVERVISSDSKVETTSNELLTALTPPILTSHKYYNARHNIIGRAAYRVGKAAE